MDEFSDSARKMKIWSSVVVGTTFSVFLVFSQAWAEFLKEAIVRCTNNFDNDDPLVQSLIYSLTASTLCFAVLIIIYRVDKCIIPMFDIGVERLRRRPRLLFSKSGAKLVIENRHEGRAKTRKDVARAK